MNKLVKWIKSRLFPPKYWYILYKDGKVDGGLINIGTAVDVAAMRRRAGIEIHSIIYTSCIKKHMTKLA